MRARPKIDGDSGAQVGIDISHSLVHQGHHYVASGVVQNTTTVNFIVSAIALSNSVEDHCIFQIACGAEAIITATRGATWTTTGGVIMPSINRNEMSSNTSELIIYAKPTISASGTALVYTDFIPGGTGPGTTRSGTGKRGDNEFILKPGQVYQINVSQILTGTVGLTVDHYRLID